MSLKPRGRNSHDDGGLAMIAAVICLLVVMALTTVAVQQSVGSLSGFAQGRKLLQTVDAAEAGVQGEISALQHWLASPSGTLPCQGGGAVAGLPSGQGWVSAGSSSADSVTNGASLGYYSLWLATYATEPTGAAAPLPPSAACYGNSIPALTGTSWYVIVQAQGVTSATTGGSSGTGRTLQALLHVQENSTSAYYTSNASAQALNVSSLLLPGGTTPGTPASTTASYSGYGPPDSDVMHSAQPSQSLLNGETWLTAGTLAQYAEADSLGSSQSCAGLVASPGTVQAGSATCASTGSPGATGVTLDLSKIPDLGSAISSIADVTLETSAISSTASMGAGGSPATGLASFGTLYVTVAFPLGSPVVIPVSASTLPNQNLMSAVTNAITGDSPVLGPLTSTLVAALGSTLALTSNYQTTTAGVLTVSAVHVSILSNSVSGDVAVSTVGPNTLPNDLSIVSTRQVA